MQRCTQEPWALQGTRSEPAWPWVWVYLSTALRSPAPSYTEEKQHSLNKKLGLFHFSVSPAVKGNFKERGEETQTKYNVTNVESGGSRLSATNSDGINASLHRAPTARPQPKPCSNSAFLRTGTGGGTARAAGASQPKFSFSKTSSLFFPSRQLVPCHLQRCLANNAPRFQDLPSPGRSAKGRRAREEPLGSPAAFPRPDPRAALRRSPAPDSARAGDAASPRSQPSADVPPAAPRSLRRAEPLTAAPSCAVPPPAPRLARSPAKLLPPPNPSTEREKLSPTAAAAAPRGTKEPGRTGGAEPGAERPERDTPPGPGPGQRRAHLRRAVRAGPGAAAGGESQLAGAGARRAWWGFRHVSDVGTTWGPRPAHATAHSGVEAPAEKPAEAGGGTGPPAPLRPAPGRCGLCRGRAAPRWCLRPVAASVPGGSRPLRSALHRGEVGAGAAGCGQPYVWFRQRSSETKRYPGTLQWHGRKGEMELDPCRVEPWGPTSVIHLSVLHGCSVG